MSTTSHHRLRELPDDLLSQWSPLRREPVWFDSNYVIADRSSAMEFMRRLCFMGGAEPRVEGLLTWLNAPLSRRFAITRGYALVAVVSWAGLAVQNLQLQFGGDIWQHIPAVNEFMASPGAPDHIFLSSRIPHQSLNAYHLFLASLGGLFGLSSIHAVQLAGVFNSAAILILFPQFVKTYVDEDRAPLLGLLLVLLAWGPGSWQFSGFLNLNSFGFGTPYPSHFAIWMSFAVIWGLRAIIESKRVNPLTSAAVGAAGFLIANAHPVTFGGMLIFAVGLVIERQSRRGGLVLVGSVAVAVVGVLVWPYFSLVDIIREATVFDAENQSMYTNVLIRTAPALLGFWPLFKRFRRNKTDALVLVFSATSVIYLAGFLTDRTTLGRILPWALMSLQLALAGGIAAWFDRQSSVNRVRAVLAAGALMLAGVALSYSAIVRMVPKPLLPSSVQNDPRLDTAFEYVIPLRSAIEEGDVILAPQDLSTPMAAAGADLVTFRPVPFVPDQKQRKDDVEAFFEKPDASVITKYHADWIAFQASDIDPTTAALIRAFGDPSEIDSVSLVKLR